MEALETKEQNKAGTPARTVQAYGTTAADARLEGLSIKRRIPAAHDVEIEILLCGVCHSDLHTA